MISLWSFQNFLIDNLSIQQVFTTSSLCQVLVVPILLPTIQVLEGGTLVVVTLAVETLVMILVALSLVLAGEEAFTLV